MNSEPGPLRPGCGLGFPKGSFNGVGCADFATSRAKQVPFSSASYPLELQENVLHCGKEQVQLSKLLVRFCKQSLIFILKYKSSAGSGAMPCMHPNLFSVTGILCHLDGSPALSKGGSTEGIRNWML